MSKSHHRRTKSHERHARKSRAGQFDGGVYLACVFFWAVIVTFTFLITQGDREAVGLCTVGYLMILALLVNGSAFRAYQGRPLTSWRAALARIPLRPAGFGGRNGRPIEAAHEADGARIAIMVSIAVSAVILAVMAFLLVPGLGLK